MAALELILLLLAVAAALRLLSEHVRIPYPSVLVVGGALLAITPALPDVSIPPDVLFLVFVPPLLYWSAVSFPLRDFRRELGPIVRLAVLMVLVSMTAVAAAVHVWDGAFTWPAAFTLGAVIAAPDPVAVLSMRDTVRLPRAIESILEGEGLFNDVTALIAYRMAVAAAVTGTFHASHAAIQFVLSGAGGIAVGLATGLVVIRAHRLTRSVPAVEITVSLLTPFASYLLAEHLGASGVLSVVATGMYTSRAVPRLIQPQARVQTMALWSVVTFVLESLVFILIGLELPHVTAILRRFPFTALLREAALVTAAMILARVLWIMPSTYVARIIGRVLRGGREPLPPWREIAFIAWTGLRGGDSLVIALALPYVTTTGAPFPAREQIIFITFVAIFATLVLQGPTLAPLARLLHLERDRRDEAEEAHARLAAAEAGLRVLSGTEAQRSAHPEVVRYLKQRHRQRARRWATQEAAWTQRGVLAAGHHHAIAARSHEAGTLDERRAAEYRRMRAAMIHAEQRALLDMRDRGEIADDVMRRVQRDLDFEAMLLESREPVVEPPSEVSSAIASRARGDQA